MYILELVCVSVVGDRLEVDKMYLPQLNFTLFLGLNLITLTRLASSRGITGDPLVSVLTVLRLRMHACHIQILFGYWGSKLCGRHFFH